LRPEFVESNYFLYRVSWQGIHYANLEIQSKTRLDELTVTTTLLSIGHQGPVLFAGRRDDFAGSSGTDKDKVRLGIPQECR
jgi:hypothetical protein